MPDVVQATSQVEALQASVWIAMLLWVMGAKQHCTPKSRTPGLAEKDFKGLMS